MLVFLKQRDGDNGMDVVGGSQGVVYLQSNWRKPDGNFLEISSQIIGIMTKNGLPISLPSREWIFYPFFTPYWLFALSLVIVFLLFGTAVITLNGFRKRRNLPGLLSEKGWNLADWFWSVTWLLSLAFAIYVAVTITYLWWIGLIAVVIFGGATAPLAVKRYIDRHKISQSGKIVE